MLSLTFLGVLSACPTEKRNTISFVLEYDNTAFLFECSEGTTQRLRQAKISLFKIKSVFISHFHGDHYFGLLGLFLTMSLLGREKKLTIYGPERTKEFVQHLLLSGYNELTFPLEIVEITGRQQIYEDDNLIIESFPVNHGVPTLGYIIREKKKYKVDQEKMKEYGLTPGPEIGKLKKGIPIEWQGKIIRPEDILVDSKSDISIFYSGDTLPIDYKEPFDVVIHECTFSEQLKDRAQEYLHSWASEVAKIAKKNNVKLLILTHFSQRYEKTNFKELYEEAKKEFENIILADDLMKIILNKKDGILTWEIIKNKKQSSILDF